MRNSNPAAKKVLCLFLAVATVATIATGCKKKEPEPVEPVKDPYEDYTVDSTVDDDKNPIVPDSLVQAVDDTIAAAHGTGNLIDLVVDMDAGGEVYDNVYYQDSDLIRKALARYTNTYLLVESDDVSVTNYLKVTKAQWDVHVKDDSGNKERITFVKTGTDEWKLNIHDMTADSYFDAPTDVTVYFNDVEVTADNLVDGGENATYRLSHTLYGIQNIVKYSTEFNENYEGYVYAGTEDPVDVKYELTNADLEKIVPEIETLWARIKKAAIEGNASEILSMLSRDADITADELRAGMKGNGNAILRYFITPEADASAPRAHICYMKSANLYHLNLVGEFVHKNNENDDIDPTPVTCWVEVSYEDGEYKIRNVSEDVWLSTVKVDYVKPKK